MSTSGDGGAYDAADEEAGPVPPYVITGGRSRPTRTALTLVTLIAAVRPPDDLPDDLTPEHGTITGLCRSLLSVAEVAAYLRLPVSVTKVLVADLLDGGYLEVRSRPEPAAPPDALTAAPARLPDRALLEEVLDGLRQL